MSKFLKIVALILRLHIIVWELIYKIALVCSLKSFKKSKEGEN